MQKGEGSQVGDDAKVTPAPEVVDQPQGPPGGQDDGGGGLPLAAEIGLGLGKRVIAYSHLSLDFESMFVLVGSGVVSTVVTATLIKLKNMCYR